MPTTTSVLGGGIVINEIHNSPSGPGQDYNGNGTANGGDSYIEIANISGGPIDISGWEIHTVGSLSHTFAPGTILPAGGRITVVNSGDGTGFPITGVSGTYEYSDANLALGALGNTFLYDPGANQYVVAQGPSAASWYVFDENALLSLHSGASLVGGIEVLPSAVSGQAYVRGTDGDSVWITGGPSPGFINCFLTGTLIATPEGEVAVESLRPGDRVLTADGRAIPVTYLFEQRIDPRFGPAERLRPIRIRAGALGGGLPHSDLRVTADHGMLVSGVICHAGALANGTTIVQEALQPGEGYTVYHVECAAHEILLANGAAAESFIDNVGRQSFDNWAGFVALYGADQPEMEELPHPRAMSARQVPQAIRARLSRSAA